MKITTFFLLAALTFSSCENYLDIEPVGKVIASTTTEYRALLTDGYTNYPYSGTIGYFSLLSDEIGELFTGMIAGIEEPESMPYTYSWRYGTNMYEYHWQFFYKSIFDANVIIDQVMDASVDGPDTREQLLGEAYALRAYNHFMLANLYGKWYDPATASSDRSVPISKYIDITQKYTPSTVQAIYAFMLEDLSKAHENMETDRQTDATLNYRFSRHAAKALESRVRLYMQDWKGAYEAAMTVMPFYDLTDLNTVPTVEMFDWVYYYDVVMPDPFDPALPWKATSSEAILALDRPFAGMSGDFTYGVAGISSALQQAYHYIPYLESDDLRGRMIVHDLTNLIEFTFGGPFIVRRNSDRSSIRVSEMYLTAAEAAANLGTADMLAQAKSLLKKLVAHRMTPEGAALKGETVDAMNQAELLQEIAEERFREFAMEGHRWFDLRRTSRPALSKVFDEAEYTLAENDSRYTLPFPSEAIANNPELAQ